MLDRDFRLHVTFPCDLDLFLAPNKVDWRVGAGELRGLGVGRYSKLDSDAITFTQDLMRAPDLRHTLPDDVTVLTWNMEVVQFLRHHRLAAGLSWVWGRSVPDIYRRALGDLFTPNPEVVRGVETFRASVPAGRKLVCAQMRLGKQPGFPDVESWHSLQQFPILLRFLAPFNHSHTYRLFIASDSKEIVSRAQREFPEVILSIPGPITHTDKSRGEEACEGLKKTLVDQLALALCDVLVISESGLGKVASFMRGTDQDLYLFHDVTIEPFTRNGTFVNKKGW